MRLMRLVVFDFWNGIARYWYRYTGVFLYFIFLGLVLWTTGKGQATSIEVYTFGDYYINSFAGIKEYYFNIDRPFNFPALWLFTILIAAYLTLHYPYQDLQGIGQRIIAEAEKRSYWWYSKCLWTVLSILFFYLAFGLATAVIIVASDGSFSMDVSPNTPIVLGFDSDVTSVPWDIGSLFVLFPIATIAVCLFQLYLSLLIKPMISFLFTISVLFFSSYYMNPLLIGNYLMAARSDIFVANGMAFVLGIALSSGLIACALVFGNAYVKKMDIIGRG